MNTLAAGTTFNLRAILNTPKKLKIFLAVANDAVRTINNFNVNISVGITEKSRVNRRNIAMTRTAELLQVPDLLASSEEVMLNLNGKILKGTFMKKAVGDDSRNLNQYSNTGFVNSIDAKKSPTLIKKIADLQILDFLSGNPDRHSGNIFYKSIFPGIEEARLVDIQGIDNDTSFGRNRFEKCHAFHQQ